MEQIVKEKYLNFDGLEDSTVKVIDKDRIREYNVRKGHTLYNILRSRNNEVKSSEIKVIYDETKVKFDETNERKYLGKQLETNKEVKELLGIKYKISGNITNPKRIMVTFPGFSPYASSNRYVMSNYESLGQKFHDENLILAFMDDFGEGGSFMLNDDDNKSIINEVMAIIKSLCQKFQVEEKDLIMFGTSKGASIALIYGSLFPKSQIISLAPLIKIVETRMYVGISKYTDLEGNDKKDIVLDCNKFIKKINENKQRLYLTTGMLDFQNHFYFFNKDLYDNPNFEFTLLTEGIHLDVVFEARGIVIADIMNKINEDTKSQIIVLPKVNNSNSTLVKDFNINVEVLQDLPAMYLKLNNKIKIKLIKKKIKDNIYNLRISSNINHYLPFDEITKYDNVNLVSFVLEHEEVKDQKYKKLTTQYIELDLDKSFLENIVKEKEVNNIYDIRVFEHYKTGIYFFAGLYQHVPAEIKLRYVRELIPVIIKVKQVKTGVEKYLPLQRENKNPLLYTKSFLDVGMELEDDDEISIIEIHDGEFFEQKFTLKKLMERNYHKIKMN